MAPPRSIPRYRHWLSYLWEQSLEVTSSEFNEYLEVCLVHGRLQLVAEEAIYSFGDYYLNFRKLFEVFDYEQLPEHASVLVLGLGLGSIPELLEKYVGVEYTYVAVEIDPVIIELASHYSLPELASPLEVVQADAFAFLQLDDRRYDLICVDVFQDALVPEHLDGFDFVELLRSRLHPGGALVYNRLASSIPDRNAARSYFEETFAPAFTAPHLYDTGGNYLLVNDRRFLNLPA
ncbi:spermine/spermidine synthase [Neolewinella xylanilytica]|uniref:Spermine/spermidine synthase n=1 Tax=Neolewinella xylanilytica TaxID=1514080 RepID=A0A2S6I1Z9_9BACT|nr:fused MFS/spermidine synthase [Neolewinella xylanilytica]PPK85180.1 spermine/spermidine synthase [Neolewinella xylanilytica]